MAPDPHPTDTFAASRPRLLGLAYRMLGSRADAEDVLQDAWLRYQGVAPDSIRDQQAWLTTVVTRLSLDRLKRAQAQREVYVGPWLPEPVSDAANNIAYTILYNGTIHCTRALGCTAVAKAVL